MPDIAANLERIRERIAATAAQAGRRADEVKLIAVTKSHPVEAISAAIRAGQRAFGENTAQEALTKISALEQSGRAHDIEWHFIGHLQSNKAKFVPGNFQWLHSLDSLKLAQRLSRLAQEQPAQLNVLTEVNITGDPAKHGVAPNDLPALLDQLLTENLPALALRGLMAIGPYPASDAQMRHAFAAVRKLRDDCARRFALPALTELSMGMSGDFEQAILEGATMVRVGTAIFGERNYEDKRYE